MRIVLDRQSAVPLYQQIENHLRQSILSGSLAVDTRLPATRQLARDLGVNRITVENAYAELEADGLIFTRQGSGAYVLPSFSQPPALPPSTEMRFPLWQQEVQSRNPAAQVHRPADASPPSQYPDPISFSGGGGDTQLFPAKDFQRAIQSVIRRDSIAALEYGENSGYAPLRNTIAHITASQGLPARPENVLITSGSQQALVLAAQLLLKPGDTVLVESPTYAAALELFRLLNLKVVGIALDKHGMQVEELEILLQRHHPKLIYTIPNFHNPTGTCMSGQRRRLLIALAERYNVPVLEDDFVGDLRYEGRTQPALKSLDPGGRVIYVSTFSKMLMPGLRVGFLIAEGPVYEALVNCKRLNDLATSSLIQRALEAYVTVGRYQTHLRRSCQVYRKRRDAMLQAIQRHLPAEVQVETPQGGLFLWLRLPPTLAADELLPLARQQGVSFAPGSHYFPEAAQGRHALRLNFASQPPQRIEEGIRRLGRAMQRCLANP